MKRVFQYIARQFGKPTGFGGKVSTFIMNCMNKELYRAVENNLDIRPADAILDIGFGNGYLIRRLTKHNLQKLYGVEISADMLNITAEKSKLAIEEGRIELSLADVQQLPYSSNSIDKAYTVNTVYFWNDVDKSFAEIRRVLKPGGVFLNVIYLKEWMDKLPVTQYGFTKYGVEEISEVTVRNRLKVEKIVEIQSGRAICVIASK